MKVLAIDPGTEKCGLAVVCSEAGVVFRGILAPDKLAQRVVSLARDHRCERVVLGRGTGSEAVRKLLAEGLSSIPIELVDEGYTTLRARERYFRENPPHGLWRVIPISMQYPREPFDDYVAVILAERWLQENR